MALNAESIPMRWPAGPLDIARGEKTKGFTADTAEVLRKWQVPASLALVQGTPINCLVVSWAADAGQQQALKPLIEKGKQAGLEFVGLIEGETNRPAAVAAAKSAGLSAVAMEGEAPANAGVPIIPWNKAAQVRSSANSPVLGISDGVFPGLPQAATQAGGPTNLPWVDSNGAVLLIALRSPPARVWIDFDRRRRPNSQPKPYMLAVADRPATGASWVISLDDQLLRGPGGHRTGRRYVEESHRHRGTFFEQHKQLMSYRPWRPSGGDVDFRGPDWETGEEALNLLPRLRQPCRVIARSRAAGASFAGLQAIFYVDKEAPDAACGKSCWPS